MEPGTGLEQQPYRHIRRPCAVRVLYHELRSRIDHGRLPAGLILAPNEAVPLIRLQARDPQILGVVIVNTLHVFTRDTHEPGDGGSVGVGELSGLFEAVAKLLWSGHGMLPVLGHARRVSPIQFGRVNTTRQFTFADPLCCVRHPLTTVTPPKHRLQD